jgi:hypothetical protein
MGIMRGKVEQVRKKQIRGVKRGRGRELDGLGLTSESHCEVKRR